MANKVINGNVEIISNFDKFHNAGFTFAGFITADGILICVKIHSQFELGYIFGFTKLF